MLTRRELLTAAVPGLSSGPEPLPEKVVVLTFDDAVKSHRTFVAPLLKELGFRATFFVTHAWMNDPENFMTWDEIGEIHQMGFEIGNHTWTHRGLATPRNAARLASELYLVEQQLDRATPRVPKPVSFAYPGNRFGPEAVQKLSELGYRLARRGAQPEVPYGKLEIGEAFDPRRHHPLLIPTTADAYPDWTLDHFRRVVERATPGRAVVIQFHGVPDRAHPWVHTPPERFVEYMAYLKDHGFRVIALTDLARYIDFAHPPNDPLLKVRYGHPAGAPLPLPMEVEASRAEAPYWLENMIVAHRYSIAEAARVLAWSEEDTRRKVEELGLKVTAPPAGLRVLPYPGGRPARLGALSSSIDPQRGTKASVFLPWDPSSYVVVDLPEAIFWDKKLLFLAHTHIPTIWDEQNLVLENLDWVREASGGLWFRRVLPNQVAIGARIQPQGDEVSMEVWVENHSSALLSGLRAQICVMLKGAAGFNAQTVENKVFRCPSAVVRSVGGDRWIGVTWQRCVRAWGNPAVPCLHADPAFPDCAPGETVRLHGTLWFHAGTDIEGELRRRSQVL